MLKNVLHYQVLETIKKLPQESQGGGFYTISYNF